VLVERAAHGLAAPAGPVSEHGAVGQIGVRDAAAGRARQEPRLARLGRLAAKLAGQRAPASLWVAWARLVLLGATSVPLREGPVFPLGPFRWLWKD